MKNRILYIALFIGCTFSGLAQSSLSFNHLGNTTFQNSFQNPAWIPEGKVFIGLPVISGVHANVNNKFSYNEFIVKNEFINQIDAKLLYNNLQNKNMATTAVDVNLLHLGFTTASNINFSIFANERIEGTVLYPKRLIEFAVKGNAAMLGQELNISDTRASVNHYREYGIGIAMPYETITIGVHLKYLQGFFNASTSQDFQAFLSTNPEDYSLDLSLKNGALRTSGFDILRGREGDIVSHLISNTNRGAAIDLGFKWRLDDFNSISASITDLGFISWNEDITNYTIQDTTFNYAGISLKSPGDLERTVRDTLFNKFKNDLTKTDVAYTSMITPKAYLNWDYKTPIGGYVMATYGTRYIQGQLKHMMGVGYRHPFGKFFVASANITRLPQQFLNLGAALSVKGGPAQFYLAVDQLVNYDATQFKAIDVRVGINLIFGANSDDEPVSAFANNNAAEQAKGEKVSSWSFLGSKVKAKKKQGIYTIIGRQKRRDPKEYKTTPEDQ